MDEGFSGFKQNGPWGVGKFYRVFASELSDLNASG